LSGGHIRSKTSEGQISDALLALLFSAILCCSAKARGGPC
jgi:hypothetical protein